MNNQDWVCTVEELCKATGGQVRSAAHADFFGVGTDTRHSLEGLLFIPLKGAQFDAHDFIANAVEQRARVILHSQWRAEWEPLTKLATFVQVPDTLQALQSLARFWRKKNNYRVVAITGSNGKTSTKDFTYGLLKDTIPTHASKGSYNNHWGVPLSILGANSKVKTVVLEMGMSKSGEIWRLCQIAEPNVVAVTTVGKAHIGELGSQAKIAEAKEEIYTAAPTAIHIFNMDNEWTMRMQSRSHAKQIKYSSFNPEVDVHFRAQRLNWDGLDILGHVQTVPGHTWVHVVGRQNTVNLMCAAAIALAVGLRPEEIWAKLSLIHDEAWGRNQILQLENGARVFFDAYNANPDSLCAMFKNLYEMDVDGRKFLVVGDLQELGTFTDASHEEVGERAGAVGFEAIWYIGKNSAAFARGLAKSGKQKTFLISAGIDAQMCKKFGEQLAPGDLVAVKGSRGIGLEAVVESWALLTPLGKKP